jgi:PAS domain S-box-containing protein
MDRKFMDIAKAANLDQAIEAVDHLLDAVPDAMVILGADGRMIRVNAKAEKLFGYSREELLGHKPDLLMPWPRKRRNMKRRIVDVARPRMRPFGLGLEAVLRRRDGTALPVVIDLDVLKIGSDILISSAVRALRRKPSAELDLRALVEASDDAIVGTDLDGNILSWNKGAEKICGYRAEEILGRSVSVFVPPDRLHEYYENLRRLRRGEHIQRFETIRIRKDGRPFGASITISPVKGRGGAVVGASVVARDITEQRQTQKALRLSEERFRIALKNAPVVVFSHDLKLRFTWVNSPHLFPPDEYIGRTDIEIFGVEDGAPLMAIKEEVLRTGIEAHTEVSVTVRGEKHYFDLVVEPLRDPSGRLLGLLCSAIDTTFLKETIVKLQQALNEVQVLKGLLPICANCKRIKDEHEQWQVLEAYLQAHTEAKFTHGICPECLRKLYPEYYHRGSK